MWWWFCWFFSDGMSLQSLLIRSYMLAASRVLSGPVGSVPPKPSLRRRRQHTTNNASVMTHGYKVFERAVRAAAAAAGGVCSSLSVSVCLSCWSGPVGSVPAAELLRRHGTNNARLKEHTRLLVVDWLIGSRSRRIEGLVPVRVEPVLIDSPNPSRCWPVLSLSLSSPLCCRPLYRGLRGSGITISSRGCWKICWGDRVEDARGSSQLLPAYDATII